MLTLTLVWRDPPGDTIHNKLHSRLISTDSGKVFTSDDEIKIRNNVQKISMSNPTTNKCDVEIGVNITKGLHVLSVSSTRLHNSFVKLLRTKIDYLSIVISGIALVLVHNL